jgi:hypothetical protein
MRSLAGCGNSINGSILYSHSAGAGEVIRAGLFLGHQKDNLSIHRQPSSERAVSPAPARLSFQDVPLRFRRSIRLAPGIRVNLGLHGAG